MTIKKIIKFQLTKSFLSKTSIAVFVLTLSSCVSQNFKNENPVIEKQVNRDDIAATRISLGLGYLKMGNMAQAKLNLEKAKNFAPELVQVYTAFAHYYEVVGEHKRTIEAYETALSIKKNDADTLNNYGVYLCRQDKVDAAEKQFLKAIAVPSYLLVSKSYANLSSCYLQVDNFVKAEMYLNKAILHNPSNASVLFQMIRLQYALSEYSQAKVYLQRFEKATRRFSPESLALAFKVYLKLRNKKIAKNYSTLLVKMYPKSWESIQFLLNELTLIDADNLAKRFQLTQMESTVVAKTTPKRVIKLSPNKKLPNKLSPNKKLTKQKLNIEKTADPITSSEINTKRTIVLTAPESIAKTEIKIAPNNDKNQQSEAIQADAVQGKTIAQISEDKASEEKSLEMKVSEEKELESTKTPIFIQDEADALPKKMVEVNPFKLKVTEDASNKMREFKPKLHLVLRGESFYSISMKYNIKIRALKRWNKKSAKRGLRIADKLHLVNPVKVKR